MKKRILEIGLLTLTLSICFSILGACAPAKDSEDDEETEGSSSTFNLESGDLIISNLGSRDVKVFDSNGNYKGTLLDLDNSSGQAPYGIAYNFLTQQILVAVDGTAGRVIKGINRADLTISDFSTSAALNNTLRGLTMLTTGELLVVISGGNRVEKLNGTNGSQITAGAWPKALQTTGTGVSSRASGTFVSCSTGTDAVRLYDATGAQTATASSGIVGTTDVMDCQADANGDIYSSFNGTTDTIRKYNATLGATTWSYSNTVLLPNPTGIAVRADGTVLALDQTHNHVLVIAADGSAASPLGVDTDNLLNAPQFIMILP